MEFAQGVEASMAVDESFANEAAAAAYWIEGAARVTTRAMAYRGGEGQEQIAKHYRGGDNGTLIYIHGGGWSGGSIALNDRACHRIALLSGWDVVSISYRLAPEHPYPAARQDCLAALRELRKDLPDRLVALGGASAGANLALSVALDERVDALVLFYGVYGDNLQTPSHLTFATGYGFTTERMSDLYRLYDPEGLRFTDPRICPLRADDGMLKRLPPSFLLAAGLDVLRDDTLMLAERLEGLGVAHQLHCEPGVVHGFINRGRMVPAADACLARAASFLTDMGPT